MSSSQTSSSNTENLDRVGPEPQPQPPGVALLLHDLVERFGNIPIFLSFEIGETTASIRNLLALEKGSLVKVRKTAGEKLDVRVNDSAWGSAEVMSIDPKATLRITELADD